MNFVRSFKLLCFPKKSQFTAIKAVVAAHRTRGMRNKELVGKKKWGGGKRKTEKWSKRQI